MRCLHFVTVSLLTLLAAIPACAVEYAALRGGELRYWQTAGPAHLNKPHTGQAQESVQESALDPKLQTPLGSIWKLFVYVYLIDRQIDTQDYVCGGRDREEVYCCQPGGSIQRDAALTRSCGLYFEPRRLGITAADWRQYWQSLGAPRWLHDLHTLRPDTQVEVGQLLHGLAVVPAQVRRATGGTLLTRVLAAADAEGLRTVGARLRVKTWSWHQPGQPNIRIGGAAGWLADGSPVWIRGPGTSRVVMPLAAQQLPTALRVDRPAATISTDRTCVRVDLFARYPLQTVEDAAGLPSKPGPLRGRYLARFVNGNTLAFTSAGEIELSADKRLQATLEVNDYVARVIEREARPEPLEAARALAIVARSYLYQNARRELGCLHIADSSASQRVAPSPPGQAARAIAAWSDSLVLDGSPVNYHLDQPGPNRLAWRQAEAQARRGEPFDRILALAFPQASLVSTDSPLATDCVRLVAAERWLKNRLPAWERMLAGMEGFERVPAPAVCRLRHGNPHADPQRGRIHVHGLDGREARLTLAHEYLHLALSQHPRGLDEAFIEATARRLQVEGQP